MIAITGATGQLGHEVITALLKKHPPESLVAIVRNQSKAQSLAEKGIHVRVADYSDKDALRTALVGVEKLLLISSSEVGQRAAQHRNVIEAAVQTGVGLLAYTSLLHADTSPLQLAQEHRETEQMLADSGLPHVLLRNGWYTENYMASVPAALAHGVIPGCAGEGKIASASRKDYAEAAAQVLSLENQAGKIYELAGDEAWTLSELAQLLSDTSGKQVAYQNMSEADYAALLEGAGLPGPFAAILADSDTGASKGGLFDDTHQISTLTGHPTTSLLTSLKNAL
ncbi:SDR family oxidoreductase [Mangrovibacter phragmitis]|uniref:SDR family oxidoreductase n=1 Tax=Mangrovibacter phragmitis TaxID=1691903 RepID=UPI00336A6429